MRIQLQRKDIEQILQQVILAGYIPEFFNIDIELTDPVFIVPSFKTNDTTPAMTILPIQSTPDPNLELCKCGCGQLKPLHYDHRNEHRSTT